MLNDFRYAIRTLLKSPGFTLVAVLTLALGIGATTAIFTVIKTVLLRPLRYPDSERLMVVQATELGGKQGFQAAPGVYLDWRERSTSFEKIVGARVTRMIMSRVDQPRFVSVVATSFDFFDVIGVRPILGRTLTQDEDQPGSGFVALVDANFWQRQFGDSPDILGRTLTLDGIPYTIIGVLPGNIRFGYFGATDVWIPIAADRRHRSGGDVVAVGRLRRGVTREAAQGEMEAIMGGIGREHVQDSKTGVLVRPLHDWVVGDVRRAFLALLVAVVFVLLICCANVANLLVARATARQKEMAIRAALGAGRFRLVRQTFVESLLLSSLGGALGLWLAIVLVRVVPKISAFYVPRIDELAIDGTLFSIAAAVSLGSGMLFGLAPAFQFGRRNLRVVLQGGGLTMLGASGGNRLRNVLVVGQLALGLVLLAGAGLMTNSLVRLLSIDLGFQRSNLLLISTILPYKKYDRKKAMLFQQQLMEEVSHMSGVKEVSASDYVPLEAVLFPYDVQVQGGDVGQKCVAMARHIAPNYLRVMGIPLLEGRDLEPADEKRTPVPVLINKTASRILFSGENPLGKYLLTSYQDRKVLEIVGIVGDARQLGLTQDPGPQLYVPLAYGHVGYVVARTAPNSGDLTESIRRVVLALDPDVPAPEVSTMDLMFSGEVAKPSFYLGVLGAFAAAGVILAALGIYGVMSYTIVRRTHEFGIRMALGAGRQDILRLVLRWGMRLIGAGAAVGLAGALTVTRLLSAMLYKVEPNDPLTFGGVTVLLCAVALLACYIPARRATKVDPMVALRYE